MHAEKQQAKISIEPLGRTNRDSIDYVVPPPPPTTVLLLRFPARSLSSLALAFSDSSRNQINDAL